MQKLTRRRLIPLLGTGALLAAYNACTAPFSLRAPLAGVARRPESSDPPNPSEDLPVISEIVLTAFGAKGDGATDDTEILRKALDSGLSINGGGLVYGISGTLELPDHCRMRDICFRQLKWDEGGLVTLKKTRGDGVDLRRIKIDRNQDPSAGHPIHSCAIQLESVSSVYLEDVEVTGNGRGMGIYAVFCNGIKLVRPYVHDIKWASLTNPPYEMITGIFLNRCDDSLIQEPRISKFLGTFPGEVDTAFQSDGILVGQCSGCQIRGGRIDYVMEGIDFNGQNFVVSDVVASFCDGFSFKFPNIAYNGDVMRCVSNSAGYAGFIVSGNSVAGQGPVGKINFRNCESVDAGRGSMRWRSMEPAGFKVAPGAANPQVPNEVVFYDCIARDDAGFMADGFVYSGDPACCSDHPVKIVGCSVVGGTGVPFHNVKVV